MQVDVEQIIERSRLGPLQWRVLILCALVTLLDGFDLQAMASVIPTLAADWDVAPGSLRWIVTAALIGVAAAALFLSPLGDYAGRRTLLIASFALVAVSMLLTATASSATELLVWRFLTGLGLGASIPNAFAITAEYVPARQRAATVTLMACGIALGAALSGGLAPYLIGLGGWQAMFAFGGAIMLVLWLPLLALPESPRFLIARARDPRLIGQLVERIDRRFRHEQGFTYTIAEPESKSLSVTQLFTDGRARATLLLWTVFFVNLGLLHLLANWLPTLLSLRLPLQQALHGSAMFQVGGIVGAIAFALAMKRWGMFRVLAVSYVATAAALTLLGTDIAAVAGLFALVLATGSGIVGGQTALNALGATMYPTTARSTGVGWALGIGRFGAILAPLVGGALLASGIAAEMVFVLAIAPTLVCAAVIVLLGIDARKRAAG
jgi:AAHS family 4-hydroxybenzoate transporter-like MFS transporter